MYPAKSFSPAVIQKSRQLFRSNKIKLVDQFGLANQIPSQPRTRPEFLFLGSTNVGKSSLLSALLTPPSKGSRTNTIETPRVSKRMGFTRTLSVFAVGTRLNVLDSPGYGFKSTDDQGSVVSAYFQAHSTAVAHAYVLIHPKRLVSESDRQACALLAQFGVPFTFVLTKGDTLKAPHPVLKSLLAEQQDLSAQLGTPPSEHVFGTSAETQQGIDELRAEICLLGGVI